MYNQIRNRMRQEIRERQIHEYFQLCRNKHLNSFSKPVFSLLFEKIKDSIHQPINMQMINQLKELLIHHQHDDNTYILLGNYMLYHQGVESYLHHHLMGVSKEGRKSKSFPRLLVIIISRYTGDDNKILDDYASMIGVLLQEAESHKLEDYFRLMNLFFSVSIDVEESTYQPTKLMGIFCQKVSEMGMNSFDMPQKNQLVKITEKILNRFVETSFCKDNMSFFFNVIAIVLDEFTNKRENFLRLLHSLFLNHPSAFQESFFSPENQNLLNQLNYLFSAQFYKYMILNLFKHFIGQFCFDSVILLLNNNLHCILVDGLSCHDNACIMESLEGFKTLLGRIEEMEEEQLLQKVVVCSNLEHEMHKLGQKQLNQEIDKLVEYIQDHYLTYDDV